MKRECFSGQGKPRVKNKSVRAKKVMLMGCANCLSADEESVSVRQAPCCFDRFCRIVKQRRDSS